MRIDRWSPRTTFPRSPSTDGFELLTTFGSCARVRALVSDYHAGPASRFDLGNALVVDLLTGTLEIVTDLTLFGAATRSKDLDGAAFDIAMTNHDPGASEAAAREVGFLGVGS